MLYKVEVQQMVSTVIQDHPLCFSLRLFGKKNLTGQWELLNTGFVHGETLAEVREPLHMVLDTFLDEMHDKKEFLENDQNI